MYTQTRLMHIYATDPASVTFCISPAIIAFPYPSTYWVWYIKRWL